MQGLDEEGRLLLREIVERLAWRQISGINTLGHCLKFIVELDNKLRIAAELDLNLRLFYQVRSMYQELGWEDLESAVRDDVRRLEYPASRMEFGAFYHITSLAERVAMSSYVNSSSKEFAAIARSYLDVAAKRPEPKHFLSFASDPANKPQASQFVEQWTRVAVLSFGRPDTPGDERAVELGLRERGTADMVREFFAELDPFLARCGLAMPVLQGVELPADVARGATS